MNAILNPPAPNEAAWAAALRYKEQMRLLLEQEENKPHLFIEPLGKAHDRATFSCGVEPLDRYLHKQAMQDVRRA